MNNDQNLWNFFFSVFFIALLIVAGTYLYSINRFQSTIGVFEFILLSLATFRLTRLFVYDKVAQFFRDLFLDKAVVVTGDAELVITRQKPVRGPRRTISELLGCPWCFGIWAALMVVFAFYATPFSYPLIVLLAVAGVASFIQLAANATGWSAEYLKGTTERIDNR